MQPCLVTRAQCLLPLPVKAMYHSNGLTQYSDRRLRFTNLRLPIGHINAAVMNLATKQVGVPNSFAASDIYTSAASPVVRPRPTSRHAHVLRRSEAGVPRGHTFRFTSSCRCASAVVGFRPLRLVPLLPMANQEYNACSVMRPHYI